MWTELYDQKMSWMDKKIVSIQWQVANIRRLIKVEKSIPKGIKRWWHLRQLCKKTNKTLLRMAKERENVGLRPPPTMDEVQEFVKDMGGAEVLHTHCITRVARSKTKSLDMDIHYGN